MSYKDSVTRLARCGPSLVADIELHRMMKLNDEGRKQSRCFYCMHGTIPKKRVKTSWFCNECRETKSLCSPQTGRDCFAKHIEPGMPKKTYAKQAKKQLENTVALYINSCSFLF